LRSKCYSKYAKVDYDELDFDELFGEETLTISKNIKLTKPVLTKYEFVRLLTDRSKQLAQGAKPMLKNTIGLSSKEIAKLELKNKMIPLIIERPIPNSNSERWKISELEIPDYLFSG
jgi:DNA-directed RNA polymerase subunit K/omega